MTLVVAVKDVCLVRWRRAAWTAPCSTKTRGATSVRVTGEQSERPRGFNLLAVVVALILCAVEVRDDVLDAAVLFDLVDSKLGQCLVRIGCSVKQRVDVAAFCSRQGYCKDGNCNFRAGDLTPRGDTRPEVFELTSVETPGTPCIDNCCSPWTNCSQDSTMLAVRSPGRLYREDEVLLPPRE